MASFMRTQEIEHTIGAAGDFQLRLTSGDVELRAVDGETARVRIEFDIRAGSDADADAIHETARFRVHEADGELHVAEPDGESLELGSVARLLRIGPKRVRVSVSAEVPASARIGFQGVSADLVATGFLGSQQYRTVSGDLVLNAAGGDMRVRGVSGDVSLRADEPIRLQANTVSGDLSAFAPRFEVLRAVTVSGDVEIEGDLTQGPDHRVETVSGDMSLGAVGGLVLEVRGLSSDVAVGVPHRSEGSRDRRRYVIGDGSAHLQFSSMSGDATVGVARRIAARAPTASMAPTPTVPVPPPPLPLTDDEQLRILRALERGEIDVDEAARRLGRTDRA
jgi:hypothetical protein